MSYDTAWHYVGETGEPAFENGWGNYSTGLNKCRFKKGADGVVRIEGDIVGGSTSTSVFTIPVDYRISATESAINITGAGNPYICRVSMFSTGKIYIFLSGASSWLNIHMNYYVGATEYPTGIKGDTGATGPGFDTWASANAPFGNNAIVAHEGLGYISQQPDNSVEPGTNILYWKPSFLPSEFDSENIVTEDGILFIGE